MGPTMVLRFGQQHFSYRRVQHLECLICAVAVVAGVGTVDVVPPPEQRRSVAYTIAQLLGCFSETPEHSSLIGVEVVLKGEPD
jgi:hypothetical protein